MVTCTILYAMNRMNIAHYIPGHLPCISPLTFDHRNRVDRYQPGHPGIYALNIDLLNRTTAQLASKSDTNQRDDAISQELCVHRHICVHSSFSSR